jgi:hypothetical protein
MDPDTYFQTLFVNVLLLIVTLAPILIASDHVNNYFIQDYVKKTFEAEGYDHLTGFSDISNKKEFISFMTNTTSHALF